ncbi:MAG: glycosyltransferase family 2 protein [Terracidiphilus sp.]|jgi:GT2 family glycosyltransferase
MDISVVVPTFNRRKIVTRTLETLFAQSAPAAAYEVIVVVDGSTDGIADVLRQLRPACRFRIIEQENRGPSAARNTGYRAAETGLVLFLDDDMFCDRGLVAAHIAAHRVLGRRVAFGALFLSADSPPSLATECFQREIGAFYLERKRNPGLEWQIANCVFSNASLPRALLAEFGGFDETFRMREDLELGIRLFRAGVQPLYIGNAIAYQYLEKSSADLIRDAEAFAAADVRLARKHPQAAVKGQLNWLAQEPTWKQFLRRMAAAAPGVADFFLAPLCACGAACIRAAALRNLGVRALQMRRRIHWYHRALELGWRPSEVKTGDGD